MESYTCDNMAGYAAIMIFISQRSSSHKNRRPWLRSQADDTWGEGPRRNHQDGQSPLS